MKTRARTSSRKPKLSELSERIEGLSEARRFRSRFPIQIHDSGDLFSVSRSRLGEDDAEARAFQLRDWIDSPKWWWNVALEALKAGQRISIACPQAFGADVAAIAAQKIGTAVFVRAIYDVVANRLVIINHDEEEVRNTLEDAETK